MKYKSIIIILSLALLMSCEKDPKPNALSYDFSQVSAAPQVSSCLISCVNERVDNSRVHARVLLSKDEHMQSVSAFPLTGNASLLTCEIAELEEGTLYYYTFELYTIADCYRAKDTYQFTTGFKPTITVTTAQVTDIGFTTAKGGGSVTVTEDAVVTQRGLCWSTRHAPAIEDTHLACGDGLGEFAAEMKELVPGTKYYVRAYAFSDDGVDYGPEVSFTTIAVALPEVITEPVTSITINSATGHGSVNSEGSFPVTERGICWGKSSNPTIEDSHENCGTGTGSFTVDMSDLKTNTKYYVRAYAINSAGTTYGAQQTFTTLSLSGGDVPTGAANGVFSVSDTQMVYFSKGNLQYQASTNTWRFAEHQYDCVGNANANISESYSGWIDLYGWATSGYNHGSTCYQPWSTSTNNGSYCAYGSITGNLFDQTGQADWGYNAISNGGNTINTWRTLTKEEWQYVLNSRNTNTGIRYAKACVNNVNGIVLLPDDWSNSYYSLDKTNVQGASYSSNVISSTKWISVLEVHGAVFLPAGGYRLLTTISDVGDTGSYWSSSYSYYGAFYVYFTNSYLNSQAYGGREYAKCIRLVTPMGTKK